MKRFVTFLGLVLLCSSLSHAAVTIEVVESGGDVVATASGSLNIDGLPDPGTVLTSRGFVRGQAAAAAYDGWMILGTGFIDAYIIESSLVFSTGDNFLATSDVGSPVGVWSANGFDDTLYVPQGYISNTPISASGTWAGQTFASLGLVSGTHIFSWGSDATADTLTINIGSGDSTNPTLLSSTPADNATGVSTDPPTLSLVFDEPVSFASGLIRMYRTSDDNEVNNRSVSGSTGSGTPNISISFENALAIDTEYYVLIPAGAFEDTAGNPYAGISSTTALSFSTGAPAPTYTVEGTVSNLVALGLVLQNNADDDLDIFTNGNFLFSESLADGSAYAVTVLTNPPGQTCDVSNGSGTIASANITDVLVNCVNDEVPTYSVGGMVSGLTGTGLALQNNGVETLAVANDSAFTFLTELVDAAAYAVTISTQPTGQSCTVSSGSGSIATADVTNVTVDCVDDVIALAPAVPIPANSKWALILLTMLIGSMLFANRRRLF